MRKKIIMSLVLVGMAFVPLGSAVASGANSGYEPLFWNGPEGYGDYNILFEGSPRQGYLMRILSRRHNANRACTKYSRKYLRTGRRSWLRRYDACLGNYN